MQLSNVVMVRNVAWWCQMLMRWKAQSHWRVLRFHTNSQESKIKYLRKAIGEKANKIAEFLDMTPEHYSRLENGGTLATNAERIFRLRVAHSLRNKAKGVVAKDNDILDMAFVPFRQSLEPVTLIFERLFVLDEGTPKQIWHFVGIDNAQESIRTLKVVA